ncbi:hypothetical protein [Streptomyces diastaticus]|uniref:hypothetical protein n=1 Tax=Streptomyces diastaticus TaxID=1956 RepID=UPI0036A9F2D7
MRTRTILGTLAALALLTACGGGDEESTAENKPSKAPSLSAEEREKIREDAGLPSPTDEQKAAYIKALNAIDADIVHGKDEKAIDRGINQCSSIKRYDDEAKLVEMTNSRFSSPSAPEGHGEAIAKQILKATHENLCPDF